MRPTAPKILVVEDSPLLGLELQAMVESCDCVVLGPAANLANAMALIRDGEPDGALLDVRLGEERIWPVVDVLLARGIPFALTTGYDPAPIPARYAQCACALKPLSDATVCQALQGIGVIERRPV